MNQVLEEVLQENCCPKTCQKGQKFRPLSDDIGHFCQTCLGHKSSTRDLLFEKKYIFSPILSVGGQGAHMFFFLRNFVVSSTKIWETFGLFFCSVNSETFAKFLGKICQIF
jgi:hypothetical protein